MSAFVFGKMPAHGDFVARGLDADARTRWDAWLSAEMGAAREAHGEAFEERFDAAPVWRFAVGGVAGAMAPSVDGVGRRFPLVAGGGGDGAACEELLYRALGEDWTADGLHAALALLDGTAAGDDAWWTPGNDDFPEAAAPGARPQGLIALMLTPREAE